LNENPQFTLNKDIFIKNLNNTFDQRDVAFNKSINFIQKITDPDILTFHHSLIKEEPKASVVIPTFNCDKYILRAVKSIQYQNISNIEIILVDDNSSDNTIKIIKNIQQADNRIKLIQNIKNMGIIYSRSIGVLSSKGKYIFTLDNDDFFLNNDIFHVCINLGEKGNFDIIEFKAISNVDRNGIYLYYITNNIFFIFKIDKLLISKIKDLKYSEPESFMLFQPELGAYPIPVGETLGSYSLRDIFLWGKCIKSKIYQKALNKFGKERYSRFMLRYEDILANYILFNTAKSFLYIQKYGIYHIERFGSATSLGKKLVPRKINLLYLLDAIVDFSQNHINNKKLEVHLLIYYLKLRNIKRTLTSNKYNSDLINSIINRILNSKYIPEQYKIIIRKLTKKMNLIKYNK
jgi:glycosyltransferase involved in cell wall biosynthesis